MKKVKWISSGAIFFIGVVVTFFTEKILGIKDKSISITYGSMFGIILFSFAILIWLILFLFQTKQELKIAREETKNIIHKNAKEENSVFLNKDSGTMYLLMALSQDTYEPLKFELLRISAIEHNNVLAAIILAGLYKSGLKKKDNTVLEQNNDMAFKLYESANPFDDYGITDWLIGFSYEYDQTSETHKMSEEKRRKMALLYYNKSAQKGFPKAENSIGKFYHYGWVTGQINNTEAIGHFKNAATAGDVYALMNCGHWEMNLYFKNEFESLVTAQNYFYCASKYGNSEAYLWLGIVCEERAKYEQNKKDELLATAKKCYLKTFCNTENKFSATGLYKLGCLIKNNPIFEKDSDIISALKAEASDDLAITCFSKAYSLFHNLYDLDGVQPDRYKQYYENLKMSFRNIEEKVEQDHI